MRLNSKVTWGLAWAGLAVVLAVPSADYLTGAFGLKSGTAAVFTSTTDPVAPVKAPAVAPSEQQTAEVTTTVTRTGVTITPAAPVLGGSSNSSTDPVNNYLSTGKALPDYISNGDSTAGASAPAPSTPAPKVVAPGAPVIGAPSSEEPTQVATAEPAAPLVAPVPFPGRPADVVKPKVTAPAQPPVIVDETALATQQPDAPPPTQLAVPNGPVPPAGIADDWRAQRNARITRYLERNGLLDDGSTASVTIVPPPSESDYDPNGFYLSDGPNSARAARRARIEQMLQDDGDNSDVTWF